MHETHDPPTAFVLHADGFREVARLDYRKPVWMDEHGILPSWDGPGADPELRAVLPYVAALLHRIVPTAQVHIVPFLGVPPEERVSSREDTSGWGGHAVYGEHAIVLSLMRAPWFFTDTAIHEAWHLVENRMSPRDRALCHAYVRNGMPLPEGYYDSVQERSARSFVAWALYQLSRSWEPPAIPSGPRTAEQIYAEVLAGRYRPSSGVVRVTAPAQPGILRGLLAAYASDARAAFNWLATPFRKLSGDYATQNRRTA